MKTDFEVDTSSPKGFVSRWSQRKLQNSEAASDLDLPDDLPENKTTENQNPIIDPEEITEEQRLEKLNALTDEDMPDVETLTEDSDYSGFMSKNVTEALRKMALQKLFHGKSYNVRDGLDEYDGNYSSFETLDPSVVTCDMKHLLQVEAEKLLLADKEETEKRTENENSKASESLVQLEAKETEKLDAIESDGIQNALEPTNEIAGFDDKNKTLNNASNKNRNKTTENGENV